MTTSRAGALRPRFARSSSGGLRRHPIFSKKSQKIVVFFFWKKANHISICLHSIQRICLCGEKLRKRLVAPSQKMTMFPKCRQYTIKWCTAWFDHAICLIFKILKFSLKMSTYLLRGFFLENQKIVLPALILKKNSWPPTSPNF